MKKNKIIKNNIQKIANLVSEFFAKIRATEKSQWQFFLKLNSRKKRMIWISSMLLLIIGAGLSVLVFKTKSATFGWLQTGWSGGADTVATADHASNQTGWTKFYSKDANVDVTTTPGQASISTTNATSVTTSDADFNAFTLSQAYVSGGAVYAKKPDGGSCSSATQCINGWCNTNVCTNPWITGPCANLGVYYSDAAGTSQWKTTNDACVGPQCATGLDASYPANYSLVASNAVDFSVYPARNACKTLGGRLPTTTELACIYANKTSYNTQGAFQSNVYWSSTEYNASNAWIINFSTGNLNGYTKSNSPYVRCVRGQ